MKQTYFLVGDLKAESQLATCGPALAKSKSKGSPTPIPTYEGPNGVVMYMPGAGIRSKLRGAITALVLEAIDRRGAKRFSLEDAQLNRVGGIKQGGAESALKAQEYLEMIRTNPILGLFGASTPWVKGKTRIGHASCRNPNLRPMHVEGVRADIMKREPGMTEYLDEKALQAYADDIQRTKEYSALKKDMEAKKKLMRGATSEEKKKLQAEIKALDKTVADGNLKHVSAQQPLEGYLAIPPGAQLDQKIALVSVSQIEFGGFLAALERFALAPELGAHVAHGAGVIGGSWQVRGAGKGVIGQLTIDPYMGLEIEGQELKDAKAAFEAFVNSDECVPYSNAAQLIAAMADAEEVTADE